VTIYINILLANCTKTLHRLRFIHWQLVATLKMVHKKAVCLAYGWWIPERIYLYYQFTGFFEVPAR
jgi:hypothetical protein